MEMTILVYSISLSTTDDDSINVYFLEENYTTRIKCKKTDQIKKICEQYESENNLSSKSIKYKYNNVELDLEKTFNS